MALIVVGSANMDLVVRSPRLPTTGETVMGTSFATFPGGKGANQAVAAAKLGAEVYFVGCVGEDSFGTELASSLEAAGVRTNYLHRLKEFATGVALISVDDSGRNTIVVAPGANSAVTTEMGLRALNDHPGSTLLIQLEIPHGTVWELLRSGKAARTILNPAPAIALPPDVYRNINVITPNETEAELLTGIARIDVTLGPEVAEALRARGVETVIVTLGEKGGYYDSVSSAGHYPAFPVSAIDTVAAGDAFSGALAFFLDSGYSMEKAIREASIAAAISTTRFGAQTSMPTLDEVRAASPVE